MKTRTKKIHINHDIDMYLEKSYPKTQIHVYYTTDSSFVQQEFSSKQTDYTEARYYKMEILQHPDITCAISTGYPRKPRYTMDTDEVYYCPECGKPTDTFRVNKESGDILGCDNCIEDIASWEIEDYGY